MQSTTPARVGAFARISLPLFLCEHGEGVENDRQRTPLLVTCGMCTRNYRGGDERRDELFDICSKGDALASRESWSLAQP